MPYNTSMIADYNLKSFQYIIAPLLGWLVAQSIKFVLTLRKDGVEWRDFTASGGMPSSHASFMMSLSTLIGYNYGIDSATFGLSLAVTMLAAYDAMDVRRATGQQTVAIQEIEKLSKLKLKTWIHKSKGHTPIEITAGLFVGTLVGTFLSYVL